MSRHMGRIIVDTELLGELLQFRGAHFVVAQVNQETGCLEIVLEHPDMPEVKEGESAPIVTPWYRMEYYPDGSPMGVKWEPIATGSAR